MKASVALRNKLRRLSTYIKNELSTYNIITKEDLINLLNRLGIEKQDLFDAIDYVYYLMYDNKEIYNKLEKEN